MMDYYENLRKLQSTLDRAYFVKNSDSFSAQEKERALKEISYIEGEIEKIRTGLEKLREAVK